MIGIQESEFLYSHQDNPSSPSICNEGTLSKKRWIFGYKLHMVSGIDSVIVPLLADVTTANLSDKPVYLDHLMPSLPPSSIPNSNSLSPAILKKIHYKVADLVYDDQSLDLLRN